MSEAYRITVPVNAVSADINAFGGKSVVMNQLVKNGSFADKSVWDVGGGNDYTVSDHIATISVNTSTNYKVIYQRSMKLPANHQFYVAWTFSTEAPNFETTRIIVNAPGVAAHKGISFASQGRVSYIITPTIDCNAIGIGMWTSGSAVAFETTDVYKLSNVIVIDLTQMFGAGNEPATVEEFEAMFPLDYYEYNPGELVSAEIQSVVSKGPDNVQLDILNIPAEIKALEGYGWSVNCGIYTGSAPEVTEYCNEIDLVAKKYKKRIAKRVFNGASGENWSKHNSTNIDSWIYSIGVSDIYASQTSGGSNTFTYGLCDSLDWYSNRNYLYSNSVNKTGISAGYSSQHRLYVNLYGRQAENTLESFKAYLSEHPITVYYLMDEAYWTETDISAYVPEDLSLDVEQGGTLTFLQSGGRELPVPYDIDFIEAPVAGNDCFIVRRGGTGKTYAAIGVTYPEGSVCTCSKGGKVLTAKGTGGSFLFAVPESGTWTVSCTDGTQTASRTVSISAQYQCENVDLSYAIPLFGLAYQNWATIDGNMTKVGIDGTFRQFNNTDPTLQLLSISGNQVAPSIIWKTAIPTGKRYLNLRYTGTVSGNILGLSSSPTDVNSLASVSVPASAAETVVSLPIDSVTGTAYAYISGCVGASDLRIKEVYVS